MTPLRVLRCTRKTEFISAVLIVLVLSSPVMICALPQAMSYLDQSAQWRRQREDALKADDGWLNVTGLYWLEPGKSRHIWGHVFLLNNGAVSADGKHLKPDTDLVTSGTRTLFVIERGGRFAIRERDTQSQYRKQFRGLEWFPVKEDYRVQARLQPHRTPKTMSIPTVVAGLSEQMISPGVVEFILRGTKCRLEPVISGNKLFFIFKDPTSQSTTYPAGRFLYSTMPDSSGRVELDFNQSISPPCAFTPHATCPLPPRQNHLPVGVEAGERYWKN